jgi:hypothetical protein
MVGIREAMSFRPDASRIFVQESVIKILVMVALQKGKIEALTRLKGIVQSSEITMCFWRGNLKMKTVWLSKKRRAVFFSVKKYLYTIVIMPIFLSCLPGAFRINSVCI